MTAEAKLYELRVHLEADPTSRGYAGMNDRQVAQDLEAEYVERGDLSHWDIIKEFSWPEVTAMYDGTHTHVGVDADAMRSRIAAVFAFLGGDVTTLIPRDRGKTMKQFIRRHFGSGSNTVIAVDLLLDAHVITRKRELGFGKRDEDQMTDDVNKARALPTPEAQTMSTRSGGRRR